MTALQQLWLASVLGATAFFAAGALVTNVRRRGRVAGQTPHDEQQRIVEGAADTRLPDEPRSMGERLAQLEHELAERTTQLIEASSEVERLRAHVSPEALIEPLIEPPIDTVGDAAIQHDVESPPTGSITEALSCAIERFSDSEMRCATVVDEVGFLVSSHGDGGVELAGYAALLNDAANRAAQFLPVASPASIELIDEQGARISVWPFHVADTRLLLVKLGVGATEEHRVQRVLSEVTRILTPSPGS